MTVIPHSYLSSSQSEHSINHDFNEHMSFMSKEAKLNAIKQYYIDNDYKFVVVRQICGSVHTS